MLSAHMQSYEYRMDEAQLLELLKDDVEFIKLVDNDLFGRPCLYFEFLDPWDHHLQITVVHLSWQNYCVIESTTRLMPEGMNLTINTLLEIVLNQ